MNKPYFTNEYDLQWKKSSDVKMTSKQAECDLWVHGLRLEENSEEISSVALLSPACLVLMSHICFRFLLSLLVFFDVSWYIALSTIPNCIRFQLLVWQQLVWPATSTPFILCFGICQHFFFGVSNDGHGLEGCQQILYMFSFLMVWALSQFLGFVSNILHCM